MCRDDKCTASGGRREFSFFVPNLINIIFLEIIEDLLWWIILQY